MQARYAESLSWLSEETGDISAAAYWIDRASQWGQAAGWRAMSAYCFVRRSMMAISFSGDGHRAVDNAAPVLAMRGVSPRMKGLATKQIAFGHALVGDEYMSNVALDKAMYLLSMPTRDDDAMLGQRSVVDDDLLPSFERPATCTLVVATQSYEHWNRDSLHFSPRPRGRQPLLEQNLHEPTPMRVNQRRLLNCRLRRWTTSNVSGRCLQEMS